MGAVFCVVDPAGIIGLEVDVCFRVHMVLIPRVLVAVARINACLREGVIHPEKASEEGHGLVVW